MQATSTTREAKLEQLKRDYEQEWWRAKEHDDFSIKNKLTRVGCRPLKRKYLACVKDDNGDAHTYADCKVITPSPSQSFVMMVV